MNPSVHRNEKVFTLVPCFYIIRVLHLCLYLYMYLFYRIGNGSCPSSHSLVVAELGLGSGLLNSSPVSFYTPHRVPSNLEALS